MQTHTQNFTPKPKIPTVDEIGSIEDSARNFQQLIAEMTRAGRQSVIAGDGPKMANLAIDAKRARYLMSCNWKSKEFNIEKK